MEKSVQIIEMLNDLISIQRWRVGHCDEAIQLLPAEEKQMLILLKGLRSESKEMIEELVREVDVLRGDIRPAPDKGGKLLLAWQGYRQIALDENLAHSKKEILASCIEAEVSVQKIYDMGLESALLPKFMQQILTRQKKYLKISQDELLAFSD